jgi:hypothetical protein
LNSDEENEIEDAICYNEQWAQREENDPPILSFQHEKNQQNIPSNPIFNN